MTDHIEEVMKNIEILWAETKHLKAEITSLKKEIEVLKERISNFEKGNISNSPRGNMNWCC